MDNKIHKSKSKLVFQTVAVISIIAVCTFYIMKLIDNESDSLSKFFIGFGVIFLGIVLFAVYINYVFNIYKEIKETKKGHSVVEISTVENEKLHMKTVRQKGNVKQKTKSNKRKGKK
jgi:Na+/melibiose symporter-like transporter